MITCYHNVTIPEHTYVQKLQTLNNGGTIMNAWERSITKKFKTCVEKGDVKLTLISDRIIEGQLLSVNDGGELALCLNNTQKTFHTHVSKIIGYEYAPYDAE